MKVRKVMAAVLSAAMVVSSAMVVSADEGPVTLTLWGAEEDQTLLKGLVEDFQAAYPDQTFDIQIGVESESTAKDTVLTDIEAAADVFAFADDQLADLVSAGALADIGSMAGAIEGYAGKTLDDVKAANAAAAVDATMVNDTMYAFPMTGGNTFFLYYDSSVISAEDAQTWDGILAAAEAAGKQVGMTLASGWYNSSFFYGAGFTTGLNEDGTTTIDWNGTSADGYTGVDVVKGMISIASSPAFMAIADGDISNQIAGGQLCAVISGDWDAATVQEAFGDGYAASKLPTFTVGDAQVQQAPPYGYKFVGVNAYSENVGWAVLLAEYLTNESSQLARFEQRGLAPTNTTVASSDAVKENVAIAAAASEAEFGALQRVGGKFWDPTATFGEMIAQGGLAADDDAAIQEALDTLVEGVTAPVE